MANKPPERENPWRAGRMENRFPTDTLLRKAGFKIHSRPRVGRDLWERHGELFTASDALLAIQREEDAAA